MDCSQWQDRESERALCHVPLMELFFFSLLLLFLCARVCMHKCVLTCICVHVYQVLTWMVGFCCLISASAASHPLSSIRSGPRRHLIAVAIVILCVFLRPARSLVSPADSFLHAWPAACLVATCMLSQNGQVKKGFPVHYPKTWSSQGKDTHTHPITLTSGFLWLYVGHKN